MKRYCIIFGANDFGRMLRFYAEKYMDISVVAYTLNEKYITERKKDGIPVIEFEKINEKYPPEKYAFILAIGYKKMNDIRKKIYNQIKQMGYDVVNLIHPSAQIECLSMGEGNIILENAVLAYGSKIGTGNIIWNGCQISHESEVGDFNYFAPSAVIAGKTVVKNNCFLGIQSAVRGGNILEDYTLVGAGSYINSSTETNEVYVPARTVCLTNKSSKDFF